jgi:DNA-3-methyladenine glycosylase II
MIEIACEQPFDLSVCLRVARGFAGARIARKRPTAPEIAPSLQLGVEPTLQLGVAPSLQLGVEPNLRLGVWFDEQPTLVEVRQEGDGWGAVTARSEPPVDEESLRRLVRRVVNADMDLKPFYATAGGHPALAGLIRDLPGLKPLRPAGLFDMLVMAVTEQQISLMAAHHIQTRLVERFGSTVDGVTVFPRATALANAPFEALTACGLSGRKAEYIQGMAQQVVAGTLDLDALETASADEVRARITELRGFGRWSADYILVRGLARVDVVPFDDLAIRRVVGRALADGRPLTPAEAEKALTPFAPFRGLAIFYLLVGSRLADD